MTQPILPPKRILAIDQATSCGFAHSNSPDLSGVWDLSVRSDESSGMRLVRFESKLREMLAGPGVDVIVFESVTVNSGTKANSNGVKLGAKLQAVIELLCERVDGLECRGYNLQTIKSFAGQKSKEGMIAAAKKKWPHVDIIDDNHADALWLCELAKRDFGGFSA